MFDYHLNIMDNQAILTTGDMYIDKIGVFIDNLMTKIINRDWHNRLQLKSSRLIYGKN